MPFDETDMLKHLFPNFFPISSLKLFTLSYNQKSLTEPDTFNSKPSPPSYNVPHLLINRKIKKKLFQFEKVLNEIKERNITPLN